MAIRLFIGISRNRGICTLKAKKDDSKEIFSFSPKDVLVRNKTEHALLLASLAQFLEISEKGSEIIFYSSDDLLSFEWETEWKKDKKFSPKTEDLEKWEEIIFLVNSKKIKLTIIGENSILSALSRKR